jgi:hypothetical protein
MDTEEEPPFRLCRFAPPPLLLLAPTTGTTTKFVSLSSDLAYFELVIRRRLENGSLLSSEAAAVASTAIVAF